MTSNDHVPDITVHRVFYRHMSMSSETPQRSPHIILPCKLTVFFHKANGSLWPQGTSTFAQKMPSINVLVPGVSKLLLKFPRKILVKKRFLLLSNCWVVTDYINKQGFSHPLPLQTEALSSEQQSLGHSHPLSKAH